MKPSSLALLVATFLTAAALCSCELGKREGHIVEPFSDVPTPLGFVTLRHEEARREEGASFRAGRFFFKGPGTPREAMNFYLESMPALGWNVTEQFSDGQTAAVFHKQSQECRVTITQEGEMTRVRLDVRGPAIEQ